MDCVRNLLRALIFEFHFSRDRPIGHASLRGHFTLMSFVSRDIDDLFAEPRGIAGLLYLVGTRPFLGAW